MAAVKRPHTSFFVEIAQGLVGAFLGAVPPGDGDARMAPRHGVVRAHRDRRIPAAHLRIDQPFHRQPHVFGIVPREHEPDRERRAELRLQLVLRVGIGDQRRIRRIDVDGHRADVLFRPAAPCHDVPDAFQRLEAGQAERIAFEDVAQDGPALAEPRQQYLAQCGVVRHGFARREIAGPGHGREKALRAFDATPCTRRPSLASFAARMPRSAAKPEWRCLSPIAASLMSSHRPLADVAAAPSACAVCSRSSPRMIAAVAAAASVPHVAVAWK